MPRIQKDIFIKNPQGLHARPAVLFVQIASKYTANVVIEKDDVKVDGRSIMGILTLGAGSESTVRLTCDGEDAEALFAELEELLMRDNIDEEQQ